MEVTQEKKQVKAIKQSVVKDLDALKDCRWKLTFKVSNPRKKEGFGGRMIPSYDDPVLKTVRHYVDNSGRKHHGIWIGEIVTIFDPINDPEAQRKIDFIIGSPDVGVIKEQADASGLYFKNKESNPKFEFVNLDYENVKELEEEDYIDRLCGRISKDQGQNALSLEKLRWILAALNKSYRYAKYTNNNAKEKLKLRSILKSFVRQNFKNAREVAKILSDLDNAKFKYIIKEMLRFKILVIDSGVYSYRDNALSTSVSGLKEHMDNNPEFYDKLVIDLRERLKKEEELS